MKFSLIIPVYNRPEELDELLQSCLRQSYKEFEIIIIEDGSAVPSDHIVKKYQSKVHIDYYVKQNEGPAIARNFGAQKARGTYLVFTDSDCILPPDYFEIISSGLDIDTDVFGGPDKAHPDFNPLQKAISYSMTSVLTTGGVRGRKKSVETFYPRSFNMGIKTAIFQTLGGFPNTTMWPGEDMILAIELNKRDFNLQYIHEAFVYHKRRTSLTKFFKQVEGFGRVRIYISKLYPHTFKLIYLFPLAFTIFLLVSIILTFLLSQFFIIPIITYFVFIFITSTFMNKSLKTGALSVMTTIFQFVGYAKGFTGSLIKVATGNPTYILNHQDLFL